MPDLWPWGIAATTFGIALKAVLDMAALGRDLKQEREQTAMLRREVAELKDGKRQREQSGADGKSDEFTKPLKYPKNHVG